MNAAWRRASGVKADWCRPPRPASEIRAMLVGSLIPPRIADTVSAASRRTLPLRLRRKPSSGPFAVRRRLVPTHFHHRPVRIPKLPPPVSRLRELPVTTRRPKLCLPVTTGCHKALVLDNRHRIASQTKGRYRHAVYGRLVVVCLLVVVSPS